MVLEVVMTIHLVLVLLSLDVPAQGVRTGIRQYINFNWLLRWLLTMPPLLLSAQ